MERDLLADFRWSSVGANEMSIQSAQAALGSMPVAYLTLMRVHDGGEGWVGDGAFLRLWPIEMLVERNRILEAGTLVPGSVFIGTDGADGLYAVDPDSATYLLFPAVGLTNELGRRLGESWEEFLKALSVM